MNNKLSRLIQLGIAAVAFAFGVVTIFSGGQVLFGNQAAREAAGSYMPFVVWFNFFAGFAYVAAAAGLACGRPWAARLSLNIAATTAWVFFTFGLLVLLGEPFEMRTIGAMTLRITLWAGIAWFAWRQVGRRFVR